MGSADEKLDSLRAPKGAKSMYSQDKISIALKVYHQCGSVSATIRILGYPTRRALYTWIANKGVTKPERKSLKLINTVEHPRNPSVEVKMNAIHRCFELGESVKSVSEDTVIPEPAFTAGERNIFMEVLLH